MLFKSHLRSILNINSQTENEDESNVVPLYTGKTTTSGTLPPNGNLPEQDDYGSLDEENLATRLEAENMAIQEAKSRIETEARARVTAEARARVEASARLAAEARIKAETAATEEARARA
ncbi:MAG: hypothetical protein DYH16_08060, partial [Nitrosomonas sp. PRO5]|nr:hypothetical protein [Nitrosomonas sp. PRO5]